MRSGVEALRVEARDIAREQIKDCVAVDSPTELALRAVRGVPSDWPDSGALDLSVHDLPHGSADTEWWYVNTHLRGAAGQELALFAAFFRIVASCDTDTGEKTHAHAVTWALTDVTGKAYYPQSLVDEAAPRMGLERIQRGQGSRDPRLNRAMAEVLERGVVPLPDRVFKSAVRVSSDALDLDFGGACFRKLEDGSYRLTLHNEHDRVGCDLVLRPHKSPIRHGDDGVVRGHSGEDMFYYFIPRCTAQGSVTLRGESGAVSGQGWYDHEFGGYRKAESPAGEQAPRSDITEMSWNWTAVQLDDGSELSAYEIVTSKSEAPVGKWLIHIAADGKRTALSDFSFEGLRSFCSVRTFQRYPVSFRLRAPALGLDLEIDAVLDDQEFITAISHPAFWEGRCTARGVCKGKDVSGNAFIERSGFNGVDSLEQFFGEVGKEVAKSVSELLPRKPDEKQLRNLIASDERPHYLDGVDRDVMAQHLIAPIRDIVDRGGKSWRSYGALACCDVVGGESRKFIKWLALPELMHVGSLIVDDVQDRSDVRRGGPAAHLLYGEAIAINAGTAAYFMTQDLFASEELSDATKLRLYDLYFQALRAGHAGQAIDHAGTGDLLPKVVETGDIGTLVERILACYRLKTAVPAASLAAMGAVVGGGSDAQIRCISDFFEALGLAFQIIDDVLNLRGFKGDLKTRGEDITAGKVTLPVAYAFKALDRSERQQLLDTLNAKTADAQRVAATIAQLERVAAIDAAVTFANELVERAWKRAETLLVPSTSTVMLRAFSWFVLERHY